jgi:hypothetical protein
MARRKRSYYKDPEKARENNRRAGVISQQPDTVIRRLGRMNLTAEQRQRLAEIAAGTYQGDNDRAAQGAA